MTPLRTFVYYGQWGVSGTLWKLASRLAVFGPTSTHAWDDNSVIQKANKSGDPIVIIGYSLGANQALYVAPYINQGIKLLVGYDPSRQSPLCRDMAQVVPRYVEKAICYYNPSTWFYGGCKYVPSAHNLVLIRPINMWHLAVPFSQELHDETYNHVKQAAELT